MTAGGHDTGAMAKGRASARHRSDRRENRGEWAGHRASYVRRTLLTVIDPAVGLQVASRWRMEGWRDAALLEVAVVCQEQIEIGSNGKVRLHPWLA